MFASLSLSICVATLTETPPRKEYASQSLSDKQVRYLVKLMHKTVATSGECELTNFAFSYVCSVEQPKRLAAARRTLFHRLPKSALIYRSRKDERPDWPE